MNHIPGFVLLTLAIASAAIAQSKPRSSLEINRLDVKDKVLVLGEVGGSPDIPESITRPNFNAGRPTYRVETEYERLERQTNLRVQNMHAIENAKLEAARDPKVIPLYESRAEVKNNSETPIVEFIFAYRASKVLQFTSDQEILCKVNLKPEEMKKITALSYAPAPKVVDISSELKGKPPKPTLDDVIINRVEFADGTTWQRRDWNPMRLAGPAVKAISKGKCGEI